MAEGLPKNKKESETHIHTEWEDREKGIISTEVALSVITQHVLGSLTQEGYEGVAKNGPDSNQMELAEKLIKNYNLPININQVSDALRAFAERVASPHDKDTEGNAMWDAMQAYQGRK